MEQNRESHNNQQDDGKMIIEEPSHENFETVTVKPSEQMREKKINYRIIGEDVSVDLDALVWLINNLTYINRKSTSQVCVLERSKV